MRGLGGILFLVIFFVGLVSIAFFGIGMMSKAPHPDVNDSPDAAAAYDTGMNLFQMFTPVLTIVILLTIIAAVVAALYLLFGRKQSSW